MPCYNLYNENEEIPWYDVIMTAFWCTIVFPNAYYDWSHFGKQCDIVGHTIVDLPIWVMASMETEMILYPNSKVHGANMGPTRVLLAPDGPHVGPMNLAIRVPPP